MKNSNKMTAEDLKQMQNWSLERKIRVSQTRIIEWNDHFNGKISVSFSGGKDSTVLLDLVRRIYPDTVATYVDTGLEFPEVRNFALSKPNVTVLKPQMRFDEVIKNYGWVYPSKDIALTVEYARKGSAWTKIDLMVCINFGLNRIF